MNTLQDFFENAKERNLCERGAKIWEHCKSKKSLIDFALGSWGADYVCKAISEKWGPSPEVLRDEFSQFLGTYVRDKDGYTSKMYCLPDTDSITIDTTLTLIIGFKGTIAANRICELYLVNCKADVVGNGTVMVHSYNSAIRGDNVKVTEH